MSAKQYSREERLAWGREQDRLRAERAARAAQGIVDPKKPAAPRKSRAKPVVFDGGSTCFDDLSYADGGVYATFANPTRGTWFYPMTKKEAKAWASAPSYGQYFNDEVR
jgi:hypothetical protein